MGLFNYFNIVSTISLLQKHPESAWAQIEKMYLAWNFQYALIHLFIHLFRLVPVSNVILFYSKTDNLSQIAIYKLYLKYLFALTSDTKFDYQRG